MLLLCCLARSSSVELAVVKLLVHVIGKGVKIPGPPEVLVLLEVCVNLHELEVAFWLIIDVVVRLLGKGILWRACCCQSTSQYP